MNASLLVRFAQAVVNCDPSTTQGGKCQTNLPQIAAGPDTIQVVVQILFGVLASVAVIIIIIAGIKFIIGQGDPQEIAKARQTIIFAAVGLVVALLAEAAVTLLLGKI
jgi:hypothetical protein